MPIIRGRILQLTTWGILLQTRRGKSWWPRSQTQVRAGELARDARVQLAVPAWLGRRRGVGEG